MRYYYYQNGQKAGPVSSDEIKRLVNAGTIKPETTIEDERGKRAKASSVPGLFPEPEPEPVFNEETNAQLSRRFKSFHSCRRFFGILGDVTFFLSILVFIGGFLIVPLVIFALKIRLFPIATITFIAGMVLSLIYGLIQAYFFYFLSDFILWLEDVAEDLRVIRNK